MVILPWWELRLFSIVVFVFCPCFLITCLMLALVDDNLLTVGWYLFNCFWNAHLPRYLQGFLGSITRFYDVKCRNFFLILWALCLGTEARSEIVFHVALIYFSHAHVPYFFWRSFILEFRNNKKGLWCYNGMIWDELAPVYRLIIEALWSFFLWRRPSKL